MAEHTTNYDLIKPTTIEDADIQDINANMDIIDGQMYQNAQDIQENSEAIQEVDTSVENLQSDVGERPSGETDTLWDKVDALDNKKITFTKLVDNKTIPTNLTTYSLENDEKFSNYDLILVVNNASDFSNRGSMLLPLGAFVSAPNNYIQVLHGSTAGSASGYSVSTLSFKYANDRQYQTALSGSGTLNIISIYGIKLG